MLNEGKGIPFLHQIQLATVKATVSGKNKQLAESVISQLRLQLLVVCWTPFTTQPLDSENP